MIGAEVVTAEQVTAGGALIATTALSAFVGVSFLLRSIARLFAAGRGRS